jgi:uncharacterized protein (DUF433 family)
VSAIELTAVSTPGFVTARSPDDAALPAIAPQRGSTLAGLEWCLKTATRATWLKARPVGENLIVSDPQILGGKPCVRGTRLSVEFLLELTASGGTQEQILAQYPQLTPDGLAAAFRYAADALKGEHTWELRITASAARLSASFSPDFRFGRGTLPRRTGVAP